MLNVSKSKGGGSAYDYGEMTHLFSMYYNGEKFEQKITDLKEKAATRARRPDAVSSSIDRISMKREGSEGNEPQHLSTVSKHLIEHFPQMKNKLISDLNLIEKRKETLAGSSFKESHNRRGASLNRSPARAPRTGAGPLSPPRVPHVPA